MKEHLQQGMVATPIWKFLIGFVAGVCAVAFPRLIATLASTRDADAVSLVFFNLSYIILAAAFAGLLGTVIAIFEWNVPRPPRETFMTALGIPAIVSAALTTTFDANALKDAAHANERLSTELSRQADIPILPATPVSPMRGERNQAGRAISALGDLLVRPAYAGDAPGLTTQRVFNPAIQIQEKPYWVVLERASTRAEAEARAASLRTRVPGVDVVKTKDGFLIVQGGGARPKSAAVLDAIRLKQQFKLSPGLLEVPDGSE